jgi:hypothetical protein
MLFRESGLLQSSSTCHCTERKFIVCIFDSGDSGMDRPRNPLSMNFCANY